jgi:hypothetical protein
MAMRAPILANNQPGWLSRAGKPLHCPNIRAKPQIHKYSGIFFISGDFPHHN